MPAVPSIVRSILIDLTKARRIDDKNAAQAGHRARKQQRVMQIAPVAPKKVASMAKVNSGIQLR
jgi:hypothetical protein